METKELEACIEIIGHWDGPNTAIRDNFLDSDGSFPRRFVEPFRMELGLNLLSKESPRAKMDVIKHYLHQLNRSSNIARDYRHLQFHEIISEFKIACECNIFNFNEVREQFVKIIHYLYTLLINEIQDYCIIYHISFYGICTELLFPVDVVNTDITDNYEKMKNSSSSAKSDEFTSSPETRSSDHTEKAPIVPPIELLPDSDYEEELLKIKGSVNQFWRGIPMDVVINHFEIMTKKVSNNGKVFLTKEQFISFLRRGFLKDTNQSKQNINCSRGEKGLIIKKFWEFFDLAVSEYRFPTKCERFIDLITECFNNWDRTTIKPFFKQKKVKGEM